MLVCSGGGNTTTTYYHMHVSANKETVSTPQARTTVKMQPCLVMVSVATLSCHLYRTKSSLLAHPSRTKPYLYRHLQSVSVLCNMVIVL